MYLVATDISEEAAYALEWTIGTVLRDGDTLLAVYAVDEEAGTGGDSSGVGIGEGATAQQETDHLVKTLSNHRGISEAPHGPSPLSNSVLASEADVNAMGRAEKERYQAAVEVSDRCVKLLGIRRGLSEPNQGMWQSKTDPAIRQAQTSRQQDGGEGRYSRTICMP